MKTDFEIDLTEGLKSPETAKKVVAQVQASIDDLIIVINRQKQELLSNVETMGEAEAHIIELGKSIEGLTDTIKNIFTVLGSKKDLWKKDNEMDELMNTISVFIMSSSTIKMGAKKDAKEKGAI